MFIKGLRVAALVVAVSIATVVAQDSVERSGVIFVMTDSEAVEPGVLPTYAGIVPIEWLSPSQRTPRYEIHVTPFVNLIERCNYGFTESLITVSRLRVNIRINIRDLENIEVVSTSTFSGGTPRTCPASFTIGQTSSRIYGSAPALNDVEMWLTETMADLPAVLPVASDGDIAIDLSEVPFQVVSEAIQTIRLRSSVLDASFSPDGQQIVIGLENSTVRILDAATFEVLDADFGAYSGPILSVSFSLDMQYILTTHNGLVQAHQVDRWSQGSILYFEEGQGSSAAIGRYSPNGAYVLTSQPGRISLWDTFNGNQVITLLDTDFRVADYSPFGAIIITGSSDGSVYLWDAETGEQIRELVGHTSFVTQVAFSPDANHVVTTSSDATGSVWNIENGREVCKLVGHSEFVRSANYSPDGRMIATAGVDTTVRVWSALSCEEIRRLTGHEDEVNSANYSPDGHYIITGSDDETARVWDVSDLASVP